MGSLPEWSLELSRLKEKMGWKKCELYVLKNGEVRGDEEIAAPVVMTEDTSLLTTTENS
jgi:hypothetical protein